MGRCITIRSFTKSLKKKGVHFMTIPPIAPLQTTAPTSTSVGTVSSVSRGLTWTALPAKISTSAYSEQGETYFYQIEITPERALKEFGVEISTDVLLKAKIATSKYADIHQVLEAIGAEQKAQSPYSQALFDVNQAACTLAHIRSHHIKNDQDSQGQLAGAYANWLQKDTEYNRAFIKLYVLMVRKNIKQTEHGIHCPSLRSSAFLRPRHISSLTADERMFLLQNKHIIDSSLTLANLIKSGLSASEKQALYQGPYYLFGMNARFLLLSKMQKVTAEHKH
jgi:hypothetical protein